MNPNSMLENKPLSSFQILKKAILNTNKHFIGLVSDISFILFLSICLFAALWIWYVRLLGVGHPIVSLFQASMGGSLWVVILFMMSLSLFNRINSSASHSLTLWSFTKEVSWPWLVEGLKATGVIFLGLLCFVIPGIIKSVHYCFFSFVVFFNKNFKENKINSLKYSKEISKGLGWWIFFLSIILPLLISSIILTPVSRKIFLQIGSFWMIYFSLILLMYVVSLISTYIYSILFFMYVLKDKDQMAGDIKIDSV